MAVLPIYTYGAPVLRKKAHMVKQVSDSTIKLIMDMFETMRKASGVGLAATQVGVMNRIVVIDISDSEEYQDVKPLALINPEIIGGEGIVRMEEGCLSIPEVRDQVERVQTVKIRYRDTNFQPVEFEASGLLARVILHEVDHLDGVLFLDHLSPDQQALHAEELKMIEQGEMDVPYPVVTAVDTAA